MKLDQIASDLEHKLDETKNLNAAGHSAIEKLKKEFDDYKVLMTPPEKFEKETMTDVGADYFNRP